MNRRTEIDLDGKGLWDYVKNIFTPNSKYTNKTQSALKKYGEFPITNIEIQRSPVISVIDKALNLVSLGKWADLKKTYNFDKLYHLYAIFTINMNGQMKKIVVEKNQSINVSDSIPTKTDQTQSLMIGTNKGLTINSLLDNTLKSVGADQFFIYDPFGGKNCQNFIKDIMTVNAIYNDRIGKFVFQDIADLAKQIGNTTVIAKGITDFAALGERVLGLGKKDDRWSLHCVVVKKPITIEELNKIQKEFIKTKNKFIRETNASFRIRNIPKQRFLKKSFRTKKLNKQISLVYGQLI